MTATDLTPAAWLALITEMAPEMRRAGVTEVCLQGVSFRMTEFIPEAGKLEESKPLHIGNPLDDPALYGGQLPGFPKLHEGQASQYLPPEDDE